MICVEAPEGDPQRAARPHRVHAHGHQDVGGLPGVMGTAGTAGRDCNTFFVEREHQVHGFTFLSCKAETNMAWQTSMGMPDEISILDLLFDFGDDPVA